MAFLTVRSASSSSSARAPAARVTRSVRGRHLGRPADGSEATALRRGRAPALLVAALLAAPALARAELSCGAGRTLVDAARERAALAAVVEAGAPCDGAACPVVVRRVLRGTIALTAGDVLVLDGAGGELPAGRPVLVLAARAAVSPEGARADLAGFRPLLVDDARGGALGDLLEAALATSVRPAALLAAALQALDRDGRAADSATALLLGPPLRPLLGDAEGRRLLDAAARPEVDAWTRSCLVLLAAELRPPGWAGAVTEALASGALLSDAAAAALAGADADLFEDDLLHGFGRAPRTARPELLALVGALRARALLPEVHDLLRADDDTTRRAAVAACARLGDPRSKTPLAALLAHPDPATAAAAADALASISDDVARAPETTP